MRVTGADKRAGHGKQPPTQHANHNLHHSHESGNPRVDGRLVGQDGGWAGEEGRGTAPFVEDVRGREAEGERGMPAEAGKPKQPPPETKTTTLTTRSKPEMLTIAPLRRKTDSPHTPPRHPNPRTPQPRPSPAMDESPLPLGGRGSG